MSDGYQVLIDSDFWCGLFLPDDAHYEASYTLFQRLSKDNAAILTTSAVVGETATVISHKAGQREARFFLQRLNEISVPEIGVTDEIHHKAIELFIDQDKKGTSYVDCVNVAVMTRFHIPSICAFDEVYHKQFSLENLTYPTHQTH